ncbi:hypothetical protein Ancab_040531 [Ancistrocladus abbreviatus]
MLHGHLGTQPLDSFHPNPVRELIMQQQVLQILILFITEDILYRDSAAHQTAIPQMHHHWNSPQDCFPKEHANLNRNPSAPYSFEDARLIVMPWLVHKIVYKSNCVVVGSITLPNPPIWS